MRLSLDRTLIGFFDNIAQRWQSRGVTLPRILCLVGGGMIGCFAGLGLMALWLSDIDGWVRIAPSVLAGGFFVMKLSKDLPGYFRDALREFDADDIKSYRTAALRERSFEYGSRVVSLVAAGMIVIIAVGYGVLDAAAGRTIDPAGITFAGGFLCYVAWRYFRCALPMLPPRKTELRTALA
jgi:hypothetical protein